MACKITQLKFPTDTLKNICESDVFVPGTWWCNPICFHLLNIVIINQSIEIENKGLKGKLIQTAKNKERLQTVALYLGIETHVLADLYIPTEKARNSGNLDGVSFGNFWYEKVCVSIVDHLLLATYSLSVHWCARRGF